MRVLVCRGARLRPVELAAVDKRGRYRLRVWRKLEARGLAEVWEGTCETEWHCRLLPEAP